jgi:transposase InsO family protein
MVECVLDCHWTIESTAERFQVDAKTVRKWRDRFLAEGIAGLEDRSSRPHRSPLQARRTCVKKVVHLRTTRRWGPGHIAHEVGVAPSTVQRILAREGLGRLDRGDRVTRTPVQRYQRERPGELIHVDVKKLGSIPNGGGWWLHGLGTVHNTKRAAQTHAREHFSYRYIHSALDDRTRLVYSEILTDELAVSAAAFWLRAVRWFEERGVRCEEVITDNGACYRSGLWHRACATTGTTVRKTRPRRPQTNGKVERFHRILLEEWAYIRPWTSEAQRTLGYQRFLHFYNEHRPHGALNWASPLSILGDNVSSLHS